MYILDKKGLNVKKLEKAQQLSVSIKKVADYQNSINCHLMILIIKFVFLTILE